MSGKHQTSRGITKFFEKITRIPRRSGATTSTSNDPTSGEMNQMIVGQLFSFLDEPVHQTLTLRELQRGLDDAYSSIIAQHYLIAADKIQNWEDEWTQVLRDPDNRNDNGIPVPFYRYAMAMLCECYLHTEGLHERAADIATETLQDLPSEPQESDHDSHDWAVVQYLRAVSTQKRLPLPPASRDDRML